MISVVLCTYNRIDSLKVSLNDLLYQDFKEYEIVIADDSDSSEVELFLENEKLSNKVIYSRNGGKDRGLFYNFQQGLKMTSYDIIFLAHDDSRYSRSLLSEAMNLFDSDEVLMVFENTGYFKSDYSAFLIDEKVQFDSISKKECINFDHSIAMNTKDYLLNYFERTLTSAPWGTAFFRKSAALDLNVFKEEHKNLFDVYLWICLSMKGRIGYTKKTLIYTSYRDKKHWNYYRTAESDLVTKYIYTDLANRFGFKSVFLKRFLKLYIRGCLEYLKDGQFSRAITYMLKTMKQVICR